MSIPFFSSPPSLSRLPLLPHPRFTHSILYSSFLLPVSLARRPWSASHIAQKKMAARCKSWRGPNTPGPHDLGWLGSRVVSVLDSGAEGPGFKSQPRCLRQAAHTRCASVHQGAKLVATLLRIAGVTAGRAESNGSRVYDSRHLQADCQEPGSAPEPYAR